MQFKELSNVKINDTIYSFEDREFRIYSVVDINLPLHELAVRIEYVNNVKDGEKYRIINIPVREEYNTFDYGYEFTTMDKDLNTAYQNYSNIVSKQIRRLNGTRANMKGLKRQYMLNMDMISEEEKTWKERGFKSERDYNEYLDEMYDDIRHGYIG